MHANASQDHRQCTKHAKYDDSVFMGLEAHRGSGVVEGELDEFLQLFTCVFEVRHIVNATAGGPPAPFLNVSKFYKWDLLQSVCARP